MPKRVLICLAHPDDESFGSGPLIAKLTHEGMEVTYICATNGDVGSAAAEFMKGHNSIADMRLAELDCAAKILGFKELILFGYRDSGMMGTAENNDPKSLWQAPLEVVTNRVLDVMRRVRPQVVLTFDPYGGYGHPDHIKIHHATLAAFQTMLTEPEHPQKLYYTALPRFFFRLSLLGMRLTGHDPRKVGTNADMDMVAVYEHLLPVHARIDVKDYDEIGMRAAACHASQMPARDNRAMRMVWRLIFSGAILTRAYPEPKPGERIERDLFENVTVNA
jgi:LmbE family N-acetylglucosaminyl deacetylase